MVVFEACSPLSVEQYMKAMLLSTKAHHGQFRHGNKEPYIMHPMRVSKIVYELTGDMRLATAAMCHDVLEDTTTTFADLATELDSGIANLVLSVTKRIDLPKADKEREFLDRYLMASHDTVVLKLADRLDNVSDLKSQSDNFRERYKTSTIELLAATTWTDKPVVKKLVSMIKSFIGD